MDGGGGDSWSVPLVGPEEGVDWQLSEIVCRSALRPGRSHDESLLIMYVPSVVFLVRFLVRSFLFSLSSVSVSRGVTNLYRVLDITPAERVTKM